MQIKKETVGAVYVLLGASCWGTTGFFVNILTHSGLTPMQIACLRATLGAMICFFYCLATNRTALSISLKKIWYFIGTGILSLSIFNWSYFNTIALSSMSIASALLYTSPIFVLILSVFLFKEPLTTRKIAAVLCTCCGCALVSGLFEENEARVAPLAIVFGIGAGFTYALYSIFGSFALRTYKPATVTLYTLVFSSLALLPLSDTGPALTILSSGHLPVVSLLFALVSTALPYFLYTKGLQHIEASKAATLATVEPLVACTIGVMYFSDPLSPFKVAGVGMIVFAVFLISLRARKSDLKNFA